MAEERPPSFRKSSKLRSPQPEKQDCMSPPRVGKEETRMKSTSTTPQEPSSQLLTAVRDRRNFRMRYFGSVSQTASQLSLLSVSENERCSPIEEVHPSYVLSGIPTPSTLLPFQSSLPTITYTMLSSSVKISTEYLGKLPAKLRRHSKIPQPIEIPPEKPPLIRRSVLVPLDHSYSLSHLKKPKPKPNLLHAIKGDSGANRCSEATIHSELVKQHHTMASTYHLVRMHLGAKMTGKELDETKEEYFNIKQLTKEAESPSPEVCCQLSCHATYSCIVTLVLLSVSYIVFSYMCIISIQKINLECLPILYHGGYNLKFMKMMKVNQSVLPNKPAEIFAILQGN